MRLKGIGVSPGVVAGRAVVLIQRAHVLRYQIAVHRVEQELRRLEDSRVRSREQLVDIRTRVAGRPELALLFDAQLLMLDDPMLLPRAADIVRGQRVNAEWAVQQVFQEFSVVFDEVADPYLRERKGDVADLVGRLRMNLRQGVETPRDLLRDLEEASVLIADELTPSIAAHLLEDHLLPGLSFDDCNPIRANHVEQTVEFRHRRALDALRGQQVYLLFEVFDADLYGFRVV